MSQINLQEGEISLNERNSITGSSGLHNLTGPRARFQPVRIKALLSLFESEDDDTEPRDSDDNSDTESLQALPDDDEDNNTPNLSKDEEPPPKNSVSKIIGGSENESGISIMKNISNEEKFVDNCETSKLEERKESSHQIFSSEEKVIDNCETSKLEERKESSHQSFSNSNSFDSKNNALSLNLQKATLTVPFKQVLQDVGNVDNSKGTIFTPQTSNDMVKRRMYNQNNMLCDMKFETRQENPIDFDNRCKAKEPLCDSAMETPMKRGGVVKNNQNSCLGIKNSFATPQTKLNNEHSQSVVETPGLIFSHWSRNNFFQTPTHNPIILPTKEGQNHHHMQDVKLRPHRFCSNEQNRIVRRPLSEAMHLNQGTSIIENLSNNHVQEHQSIVKSNLITKENCPMNSNRSFEGNAVNKIVQSLQESNKQHDNNQQSLSAFPISEKSNCQPGLEKEKTMPSMSEEQRHYELISNKAGISDKKDVRDGCKKQQVLQHNSEGIPNLKDDNFGIELQNGRSDSIISNSNGQEIKIPLPVNSASNPGSVQFSVAAKTADKKYGKIINVKGNDYLVLRKLGQGMSGEVLGVQELKTGELQAIKCVDLSCIDKETAEGCLEEVSMLDKLRAPCIINMITYEIKANMLYVVMEMGDTDLSKLSKSMWREKQLPLTMILYYWTEMLTAVKHIHDNGVIHSDLKPANFLLVRGRLKLIDFGIASTVNSDMTSVVKNTSVGTLNYISPEAINDIGGNEDSDNNRYKINYKSDVWSLGCILYSLVYGQTPFQHIRANWAKVNAITNPNHKIAFPPPDSLNRRGYSCPPPFLVDVMRRCLQHDRAARPTVSQLLQIPYVGCNCPPVSSLPSIPPSILSKIKHSLEESEWRQLLEALERRKPIQ